MLFRSSLNFSFWSALPASSRYGVRWKAGAHGKGELGGADQVWTGYWSLLAALHRAQEEGINITEPAFYRDCDDEVLRSVFRSDQGEEIPLLEERIRVMREVGTILCQVCLRRLASFDQADGDSQKWDGSYANLLTKANGSALALVELVVDNFPCYDDRTTYTGEEVLIRKRAQILVAETWAAFEGTGPGHFRDIDQLTMFADYRFVSSCSCDLSLTPSQSPADPPLPVHHNLLSSPRHPPRLTHLPRQRQSRRSRDPCPQHRRSRRDSARNRAPRHAGLPLSRSAQPRFTGFPPVGPR